MSERKQFLCWCTKADNLKNKIVELRSRIGHDDNPTDFIMINEAKPKTSRYLLAESELKIRGYKMFSNNVVTTPGLVKYQFQNY